MVLLRIMTQIMADVFLLLEVIISVTMMTRGGISNEYDRIASTDTLAGSRGLDNEMSSQKNPC